jgi:ubiquinol-cytochrome c reductase cytochrome b subunit
VHLDAPADASVDYPPRPEWYFLSIFQLLKYLPGSLELLGTIILPGLAGLFLFALPFLDRSPTTRPGTRVQWLAPIFVALLGAGFLTWQSKNDDAHDAGFQRASEAAHTRAERAIELASQGIPPEGPVEMLRTDPQTRGPDVYSQNCIKCHVLNKQGEYDAPVHTGFGSRAWIAGMIHDPQDDRYFGRTEIDDMKSMDEKLSEEQKKAVVEFVYAEGAEAADATQPDKALVDKGAAVFKDKCMDCHLYKGEGADTFDGPDMTGYGSREWLTKQITKPEAIYGELNKMPAFDEDLTVSDIQMVAIYLHGQRFAEPETGPLPELKPKKTGAAQKKEDE